MDMVPLHGVMTKFEQQQIQTHDHLSLFISATEGSHLSFRGSVLRVTSG